MSDNPGRPCDATADELAAFHVALWRETYRDLAPAAACAALDEDRRRPQWQRVLEDPAQSLRLIRDEAGVLAGLLHLAPGRAGGALAGMGEICHLYLRADHRGQGLGAALLAQGLWLLRAQGFAQAGLAVVAGNHSARAFYRAQGGTEDLIFQDPGPLWKSENRRVVWDLRQG